MSNAVTNLTTPATFRADPDDREELVEAMTEAIGRNKPPAKTFEIFREAFAAIRPILHAAYPASPIATLHVQPTEVRESSAILEFDLGGPDAPAGATLAEALGEFRAAVAKAYPVAPTASILVRLGEDLDYATLPVLMREPTLNRVRTPAPAGSVDELADRKVMRALYRRQRGEVDLHEASGWREFQDLYEGMAGEISLDEVAGFARERAVALCGEQPAADVWVHVAGEARPVARHFFPESEAAVLAGAAAEVRAILGKALAAVPAG